MHRRHAEYVRNGCRLSIYEDGMVDLAGSPNDLRQLAAALQNADATLDLELSGGFLRVRRTAEKALRVSVDGDFVTLEGDRHALEIVWHPMADLADMAESGEVDAPHVHIEYLGESDQWRTPDSVPLVITADRRS
jgi:hypothetical protein